MAEITYPAATMAPSRTALRSAGLALAASAFVALCAHISLPLFFTPVPVTLQPFAVLLVALLLAPGTAFAALALYLLEGAAGLPVFTPSGPGGVLQLLGPTGGYLLSYPAVAVLVSWLSRRGPGSFARFAWAATAGSLLLLTSGAAWLATLTHAGLRSTLMLAVVPFLPGEALKVAAAAGLAAGWNRVRARRSGPGAGQTR